MILDAGVVIASGIASLIGAILTFFARYVYPIIPRLYTLFEGISTFELLDNSFIHSVWNNIYVFVSVIVLFAIAVKLIGVMVNPDTFNDNKKGARAYYFRSVIAVVLIFIIPVIFNYSFQIQRELISNHYLLNRIFGIELKKDENVGQVLAWNAFSSFCKATIEATNETTGKKELLEVDEKTKALYINTENNMDYVGELLDNISSYKGYDATLKKQGYVNASVVYHPILCPLAGILVAYELVLLCMDTLFRSVKLSFLELMLPIILGAFVFNPDILKKWAKEFFSTYISLFLKVLGIGFMIVGLAALPGLISQNEKYFEDYWLSGLFQLFLIIAVLQLVKKIPDLINMIFGTNIKPAGGIKGRLGEMAGIGGLAQKAWTSLGNTARNVGKLAMKAPFAGVGVGAYALGDLIYRKTHGEERLKNSAAFRHGKASLFAARAALRTGNVMDTVKAYDESRALQSLTKADASRIGSYTSQELSKYGIESNGVYNSRRNKNTIDNWNTEADLERDMNGALSVGNKLIKGYRADEMNKNLEDYGDAVKKYSAVSGIDKKRSAISSRLDGYAKTAQDMANSGRISATVAAEVASMANNFKTGGHISKDNLKKLASNGIATVDELKTDFKTIKKYDKGIMDAVNKFGYKENDLRGDVSLSTNLGDAEQNYKSFETYAEDKFLNDDRVSQANKMRFKDIQSAISQMGKKYSPTIQNAEKYTVGDNAGKDVAMSAEGEWLRDEESAVREIESVYNVAPEPRNYISDSESELQSESQSDLSPEIEIISTVEGRRMDDSANNQVAEGYSPTAEEIDDIHEAEWSARIQELNNKSTLSTEEQEELEDLRRSVQRIASDRMERNGGSLDE